MDKDQYRRLCDRMKRLASRREYCSGDIRKKVLEASEGDEAMAEKVVEELVMEGYVDDLRYSSAFARDKSSIAGWGAVKIRFALRGKGIAKDLIDSALDSVDKASSEKRLEKIMEVKYNSLKEDPQWKMKLLRFGLGRGYSYDEVSDAIDNLLKNKTYE